MQHLGKYSYISFQSPISMLQKNSNPQIPASRSIQSLHHIPQSHIVPQIFWNPLRFGSPILTSKCNLVVTKFQCKTQCRMSIKDHPDLRRRRPININMSSTYSHGKYNPFPLSYRDRMAHGHLTIFS
jgi:hypothetical protein